MKKAKEIYEKWINGDSLTDEELQYGIDHFKQLSNLAEEAGPVFKLVSNEAGRVVQMFEQYLNARKRDTYNKKFYG